MNTFEVKEKIEPWTGNSVAVVFLNDTIKEILDDTKAIVNVDGVNFPYKTYCKLNNKVNRWRKDDFLYKRQFLYDSEEKNNEIVSKRLEPYGVTIKQYNDWYWSEAIDLCRDIEANEPPITASEVLALDNAEQRGKAMMLFGFADLLEQLPHRVIDKREITKNNKRWNEDGTFYYDPFIDKYELIEVDLSFPSRRGDQTNITVKGVRCNCTTTSREYFLFVPDETKTAIEGICSTFQVPVKQEAIASIYRQGDVVCYALVENVTDWKCNLRTLTEEEYLEKLVCES